MYEPEFFFSSFSSAFEKGNKTKYLELILLYCTTVLATWIGKIFFCFPMLLICTITLVSTVQLCIYWLRNKSHALQKGSLTSGYRVFLLHCYPFVYICGRKEWWVLLGDCQSQCLLQSDQEGIIFFWLFLTFPLTTV